MPSRDVPEAQTVTSEMERAATFAFLEHADSCPVPALNAALEAAFPQAVKAEARLKEVEGERDAAGVEFTLAIERCERHAAKALANQEKELRERAAKWSKEHRQRADDLIRLSPWGSGPENLRSANAELIQAQGVEKFFATLTQPCAGDGLDGCPGCSK